MVIVLYGNICWYFGYEWVYGIIFYGIDEFINGFDLMVELWNIYDSCLNLLDCIKVNGVVNNNCLGILVFWD